MAKKYKVTLLIYGNTASFKCSDPSPIKLAWKNKETITREENGKEYFYDLSKYHTMIIEEVKDEKRK